MDPPTRREVFSRSVSWKYEASDLNSNEASVAQKNSNKHPKSNNEGARRIAEFFRFTRCFSVNIAMYRQHCYIESKLCQ